MNRLTEKDNKEAYGYALTTLSEPSVARKLGIYEDIEEIIEKMYKQPVYEKCGTFIHEMDYTTDKSILYNFKNNTIEIYEVVEIHDEYLFVDELKVKDYNKTWSLTKEELEK